MPDSFSKTVPIWCCVINNALAGRSGLADWDIRLHTPPSVVGESEKSQIEANVPSWVEALLVSIAMTFN
jgi:tRNA A64-2'-O-ribosylphosphate transferase